MVMTMHVLHAGDGYTYLTRSVASADQQRGRGTSLSDYYAANGTPPGQWTGRGLADLTAFGSPEGESGLVGGAVTEAQMRALFGEGLHPNADQLIDAGADVGDTRLGRRFPLYANAPSPFLKDFAAAAKAFEAGQQRRPDAAERDQMWMRAAREHYELAHPNKLDPSEQAVRAWAGRQRAATRQPVAGYDLTFTPVKSVSVLWSLGDEDTRRTIEACHREAADESIRYLEDHALVTRRGGKGEAQIDAGGLVIAAFDHYDNRDGEPNLHTHYAVSNKVLGSDGRWSSIDGTPWFKAASTASARYNAALADKLTDRLGVEFRSRSKGADKEPVLEIAGITDTRIASHAGRTATIEQRYAELEADYIDRHQRAPGRAARYQLRQKANLDTRRAKAALASGSAADRGDGAAVVHGLRATLERARTVDVAAHPDAARGRALLEHCQAEAARLTDSRADTARLSVDELADLTTAKLEQRFNSWSPTAVNRWATIVVAQQAAQGTLPDRSPTGQPLGRADLVEQVTAKVLAGSVQVGIAHPVLDTDTGLIPERLQRRNGEHILTPVGSGVFTSARVVDAEHALLTASTTATATVAADAAVRAAIDRVGEQTGFALNDGQARLVEHFCSSGALLAVGVGPAGTGKTTSMKATIDAWQNAEHLPASQRDRRVIALAPSAVAAMKLGEELGLDGDHAARTIDKEVLFFQHNMRALAQARERGDDAEVKKLRARMTRRVPRGSMLLVDEAGMASTANLREILRIAQATGAVVRLLGDPRQLDAVDAGGALELLAKHTDAPALDTVVRFVHSERDASGKLAAATVDNGDGTRSKKGLDTALAENSLRLREGDHGALDMLDERGWTHHHDTKEEAFAAVVTEHLADQDRGTNALLLASTRDDVATLNEMLQRHHRAAGTAHTGRTVNLSDGLTAGRGDIIVTRRNDSDNRREGGDRDQTAVFNGELWRVEKIGRDGSVYARNLEDGGRVQLSPDYLARTAELGYAMTIHRAQGQTVDVVRAVVDPRVADRAGLYVGLTRGKFENQAYTFDVATSRDGDLGNGDALEAHQAAGAGNDKPVMLTSSRDVLAAALDNYNGHTAALTQIREHLRGALDPDTARSAYDTARAMLIDDYTSRFLDHLPVAIASPIEKNPADRALIREKLTAVLDAGHTPGKVIGEVLDHMEEHRIRNDARFLAHKLDQLAATPAKRRAGELPALPPYTAGTDTQLHKYAVAAAAVHEQQRQHAAATTPAAQQQRAYAALDTQAKTNLAMRIDDTELGSRHAEARAMRQTDTAAALRAETARRRALTPAQAKLEQQWRADRRTAARNPAIARTAGTEKSGAAVQTAQRAPVLDHPRTGRDRETGPGR